jgi:hypothetical protein
MWIQRDFIPTLQATAALRPALILTGSRQAGKTTLLRRAFPDHTYVSLDLPRVAAEADEAGEEFLARHPPPLVIDEVQYAPRLLRHVKAATGSARVASASRARRSSR